MYESHKFKSYIVRELSPRPPLKCIQNSSCLHKRPARTSPENRKNVGAVQKNGTTNHMHHSKLSQSPDYHLTLNPEVPNDAGESAARELTKGSHWPGTEPCGAVRGVDSTSRVIRGADFRMAPIADPYPSSTRRQVDEPTEGRSSFFPLMKGKFTTSMSWNFLSAGERISEMSSSGRENFRFPFERRGLGNSVGEAKIRSERRTSSTGKRSGGIVVNPIETEQEQGCKDETKKELHMVARDRRRRGGGGNLDRVMQKTKKKNVEEDEIEGSRDMRG
ncbi:hypothetical protein FB45DRAFT_874993 [Roridomyces roridus]|uniref:Uncharacterized protein n=1 Tax=Roridomyces roridus TaxID=1738132 RepID=A0AAD7FCE5_9AGAR|nr:hypothetical protein FB45DRAFT_874993 [Roridomyces roridus]